MKHAHRWPVMILALWLPLPAAAQAPVRRPVANSLPEFSPDGRRIAFVSLRDGNNEIYTIDPDGGNLRRLTNTPENEGRPAWSADGTLLAFHLRTGNQSAVWIMRADGSGRRRLGDTLEAQTPAWSPDGRLAVGLGAFPNVAISVLDTSGREIRRLPQPSGMSFWPAWSPDGKWIAFTSIAVPSRQLTMQIVRADGSGEARAIPDSTVRAETPAWSRDGSRIAFQRSKDGNTDIYVVNADGTGLQRVTTGPDLEEVPTWSPDGRIAFQSDRSGKMEIWIMNPDGSNPKQLTR